jgi:hypothetical protein
MTHRRLPGLTDEVLSEELGCSLRYLRETLGETDIPFSYPYGDFSSRELASVQETGFCCSVRSGGLGGNVRETGLYALNREQLKRHCDDRRFRLALRGYGDLIGSIRLLFGRRRV